MILKLAACDRWTPCSTSFTRLEVRTERLCYFSALCSLGANWITLCHTWPSLSIYYIYILSYNHISNRSTKIQRLFSPTFLWWMGEWGYRLSFLISLFSNHPGHFASFNSIWEESVDNSESIFDTLWGRIWRWRLGKCPSTFGKNSSFVPYSSGFRSPLLNNNHSCSLLQCCEHL